jgi:TolB protein
MRRHTQHTWLRFALLLSFGLSFVAFAGRLQAQETKPYMLAIVGADGNLTLYDAAGQNPRAITTDAQDEVRLYHWPTWSTDGRLAYFGVSADAANPYRLGVFVIRDPQQSLVATTAYTALDEVFTYAYWSPGACSVGDCRDLALLFTPPSGAGLALRLIRDAGGQFSHQVAGRAAPFYFSFSPDGSRMIWHRFGSRLEVYEVETQKVVETLTDVPGQFPAPMWSPVDDQFLMAAQGSELSRSDLIVAQGAARRTLADELEGTVSFAWSPDAKHVAYMHGAGKVVVIDAQTGQLLAKAPHSNIVAMFWSPQNDQVAYLRLNRDLPGLQARYRPNGVTAGASLQQPTLTWFTLNIATGQATALADFFPSRDMVYYLNFYDQFSRSHRLWSPDGRYLTYGAVDSDGKSRVMIADVTAPGSPQSVSLGTLGVWSWQ